MTPRVKVCCISSVEEARVAVSAGASALGLVGEMPSGPGVIGDSLIREITHTVPPPVATFLLSSYTNVPQLVAQHTLTRTTTIQLVDTPQEGTYAALREALPGIKLVQVIHVQGEQSIAEAQAVAPHVDAVLLDSGNPTLQVKELGGTGRIHDWVISRKIRESIAKPVFLAGGLHAENICAAVEVVQPFGVDLCNGVRTQGQLDPYKLEKFMQALAAL